MASKPSPSNPTSNPGSNSKPGSLSTNPTATTQRRPSQTPTSATRAPSLIPTPPPLPRSPFPGTSTTGTAQEPHETPFSFADIPWSKAPAPAPMAELPALHPHPSSRDGGRRSSHASPETTLLNLQPLPTPHENRQTLMIGISGAASSGKTTLAHLLLSLFPPEATVFLIQQDDFLVRKTLLVPFYSHLHSRSGFEEEEGVEEEEYDADCAAAYDMEAFKRILRYTKQKGRLPGRYRSAQDVNTEREVALGLAGVGTEVREELSNVLAQSGIVANGRAICIVDGALIYPDPEIRDLLDIKLFLRTSKATSLSRRLSRPEYSGPHVGREFFWRTRAYFENMVWRNYMREYAPLFEERDVEGFPERRVCEGLRVRMQPGLDGGVGETLRWAVRVVLRDRGEVDEREGEGELGNGVAEEGTVAQGRGVMWLERVRRKLYDWI